VRERSKTFLQLIHVQRLKSDYLKHDEKILLIIDLKVSKLD